MQETLKVAQSDDIIMMREVANKDPGVLKLFPFLEASKEQQNWWLTCLKGDWKYLGKT